MLPKPYQYSHEIIYIIPKLPSYFHQNSFPFHRVEITKHNFVQKFISNSMSIDFHTTIQLQNQTLFKIGFHNQIPSNKCALCYHYTCIIWFKTSLHCFNPSYSINKPLFKKFTSCAYCSTAPSTLMLYKYVSYNILSMN